MSTPMEKVTMSRSITAHQVNECNRQIRIVAATPESSGASRRYGVYGPNRSIGGEQAPSFGFNLTFQNGPIADGVNGITHEVLLAIIEDRLMGFQTGPFACEKNERALQHIRACQEELKGRTDERIARGVEGTHNV